MDQIASSAAPVVMGVLGWDKSLVAVLERERYAVIHVQTGELALEWARDVQPDAVILQPELPDMTGLDVCRLLYSDPRINHNVPIILLAPDRPSEKEQVM